MTYSSTQAAKVGSGWRDAWLLLLLAVLISAWDLSALDLKVSLWFGNEQGFALRSHWFWQRVMHDAVRWPAWAVLALLIVLSLRTNDRALNHDARWALGGTLIALMVVQWLKRSSYTSCPWDVQMFGGAASHVSHWVWRIGDGGPGHCFPAGHSSVAFGFLPAWVALRQHFRRPSWVLAALVTVGLVLGFVQVLRGAHFVSHVLWSGWICASLAMLLSALRKKKIYAIY